MKKMVLHYTKMMNALLVLDIFSAHDECTKEKALVKKIVSADKNRVNSVM